MKKGLYIVAGLAALALGALGSVLPLLPTTPFLLAALYCFARGSDRLSRWFTSTALYEKYLAEYVRKRGMTLRQKLAIQLLTGTMLAFPFVLAEGWEVRAAVALLFFIQLCVFIFRIPTLRPEAESEAKRSDQT